MNKVLSNRVIKNLEKGEKLRLGNIIELPKHGDFKVIGIYNLKDSGYSICLERISTKRTYMFLENQIAKYRKHHLRLVK